MFRSMPAYFWMAPENMLKPGKKKSRRAMGGPWVLPMPSSGDEDAESEGISVVAKAPMREAMLAPTSKLRRDPIRHRMAKQRNKVGRLIVGEIGREVEKYF